MKNFAPIFPLKIVLFPGSEYKLHIFEERYKKMIERCLLNNDKFGIVAYIDSKISNIGCMCKINKILTKYHDGSSDIIIEGVNRFQIKSTSMHNDGYLEAEYLEYKDTSNLEVDNLKWEQAADKFQNIIKKANIKLEQPYWEKLKNAKLKSYKIAEKSGLNLMQQQEMLVSKSENGRLNFLINHFDKIESFVNSQNQIMKLITNDGYLN